MGIGNLLNLVFWKFNYSLFNSKLMNATKNDVVDMEKAAKYISKFDSMIRESRAKLLTVALVTQNEHQDCESGNKSVEC